MFFFVLGVGGVSCLRHVCSSSHSPQNAARRSFSTCRACSQFGQKLKRERKMVSVGFVGVGVHAHARPLFPPLILFPSFRASSSSNVSGGSSSVRSVSFRSWTLSCAWDVLLPMMLLWNDRTGSGGGEGGGWVGGWGVSFLLHVFIPALLLPRLSCPQTQESGEAG